MVGSPLFSSGVKGVMSDASLIALFSLGMAIPRLNRAIKLASLMTPFTPLLNNGEPTTSQGCNQSANESLKHKLA